MQRYPCAHNPKSSRNALPLVIRRHTRCIQLIEWQVCLSQGWGVAGVCVLCVVCLCVCLLPGSLLLLPASHLVIFSLADHSYRV
jgi:hypothetical protein